MFIKRSVDIVLAIIFVLTLSISVSAGFYNGPDASAKIARLDLMKQARKLDVDISGLDEQEARIRIRQAETNRNTGLVGNGYEELLNRAKILHVNITGLSEAEAWGKIRMAENNLRIAEEILRDARLARSPQDE